MFKINHNSYKARVHYKFLIYLTAFYVITLIITAVTFHRLVLLGSLVEPGGILVFPLMYFFGDAIAEIYGQPVAKQVIWSALCADLFFSLSTKFIVSLSAPIYWHDQDAYNTVFNPLLHLFFISSISMTVSALINVSVLTRWKTLVHGKYFILRSIGSSAIGEAVLSLISIPLIFHNQLSVVESLELTLNIYLWKLMYSLIIAIPGGLLVRILKIFENIQFQRMDEAPLKGG